MIQNLVFFSLSKRITIALYNIGVITGHITNLGNRSGIFGIIFLPYEYITNCPSENYTNDTVHKLATFITSRVLHQDSLNILSND